LARPRRPLREPEQGNAGAAASSGGEDSNKSRAWLPEFKAEAELLQLRAEFRDQAITLFARIKAVTAETRRAVLADLKSFLERFPDPPSAAEARARESLYKDLQRLSGIQEIEDIVNSKQRLSFVESVKELHDVTRKYDNAEVNEKARQCLKGWLKKGIVEKPLRRTIDPDIKEAEKNDGTLYLGIFENSVGYLKYWRNKEDHRDPRAYQPIRPEELVRKPSPLTPVTSVSKYADARDNLLRDFETLENWNTFAQVCEKLQKEIDDYAGKGGDAMDVSYHDMIDFAKSVISVWSEHIQPILSK